MLDEAFTLAHKGAQCSEKSCCPPSSSSVCSLDAPTSAVLCREPPGGSGEALSHGDRNGVHGTGRVWERAGADSGTDSFKLTLAFQA